MYGDKPLPSEGFFDDLTTVPCDTPMPAPASVEVTATDLDATAASQNQEEELMDGEEGLIEEEEGLMDGEEGLMTGVEERNEEDEFDRIMQNCGTLFKEACLKYRNKDVKAAMTIFMRRLKCLHSASQFSTFLSTAGSSIFLRKGKFGRKILCQPTSVARRKVGVPRGRGALLKGGSRKRERNLAHNIRKNQPNAKKH